MIPAWSLEQIIETLTQAIDRRYPEGDRRLVGILFAPPESGLGKSEITQSLDYFHHRSADKIDFFCAGYRRHGGARQPVVETAVTSGSDPWFFNVIDFDALRKQVQKCSTWRYSGEADLILLNTKRVDSGGGTVLDWSSAICCDLGEMKKDKAIDSARRFFEEIFSFVDEYDGENPVWDFSDQQGTSKAKSGLINLVLSVLPKAIKAFYSETKHLAIRNIARGKNPPYLLSDLSRNGDFIVAVENLLRSVDEELPEDLTAVKLSEQLENLLLESAIRADAPLAENIWAVSEKPIIALRAAVVAVRLARKIKDISPQRELSLNLLRRDILFGVTGIDQQLQQDAISRCRDDYEKIVHCLVGALSDVASSSPENSKKEAIENYSRLCSMAFS